MEVPRVLAVGLHCQDRGKMLIFMVEGMKYQIHVYILPFDPL